MAESDTPSHPKDKRGAGARGGDGLSADVIVRAQAVGANGRPRIVGQRPHLGLVAAEGQQSVALHLTDKRLERGSVVVVVDEDVRVVELYRGDKGRVGAVVQEFGPLVEVRAVVLVALQHKGCVGAECVAPAGALRHPPNQESGVVPGVPEEVDEQPCGCGFAVRARHHERAPRLGEKGVRERLGERLLRKALVAGMGGFRVRGRAGISHHREVGGGAEVGRVVAFVHGNALLGEVRAHGRVHVVVAPTHPPSPPAGRARPGRPCPCHRCR
jgi:hypothetical protein